MRPEELDGTISKNTRRIGRDPAGTRVRLHGGAGIGAPRAELTRTDAIRRPPRFPSGPIPWCLGWDATCPGLTRTTRRPGPGSQPHTDPAPCRAARPEPRRGGMTQCGSSGAVSMELFHTCVRRSHVHDRVQHFPWNLTYPSRRIHGRGEGSGAPAIQVVRCGSSRGRRYVRAADRGAGRGSTQVEC